MPVVVFVIASHEHRLRDRHTGYLFPYVHRRQHSASGGFEIDDVTNARENVWLVPFHRFLQIIQQNRDAVDVGNGQHFNFFARS